MIKNILLLLLITFSVSITAQKKDKIKGNKIINEDTSNLLADFNSIEIEGDLKVTLQQSSYNSYELKTDENLVDVIQFDVFNKKLRITTTHRITRSKILDIKIRTKNLNEIILHESSGIISENKLTTDHLTINSYDKSKFELDVASNETILSLNGSSSGRLNLSGGFASIYANNRSNLKASLRLDNLNLKTKDRSKLSIEGDVFSSEIIAKNSSRINAKNLRVSTLNSITSNNSDVTLLVNKELTIYAKDKSVIEFYGNPKIFIEGLYGNAKIQKRTESSSVIKQ